MGSQPTETRVVQIFRYEVPVDGEWHTLSFPDRVLHVAARQPDVVELWAMSGGGAINRQFRVFGTGQPLPAVPMRHVGTTLSASGRLAWHVFERVGVDVAAAAPASR